MTRLSAVAESERPQDPEYVEGLRVAAAAAIGYLVAATEHGDESTLPIPAAVLVQARRAARYSIPLDTVLRRCFAGYTLFVDFLMREAQEGDTLKGEPLNRVLRSQAAAFDRLVATVTDEYGREAGAKPTTQAERQAKRVERLLAGEFVDTSGLAYDFSAQHLGTIAKGVEAATALRDLGSALDRRLLMVERLDEETVWGWLGGRKDLNVAALRGQLSSWPEGVFLAVGGPAPGLPGWRRTHQQARAAMPIALNGADGIACYSDVALLASILKDELLVTSLRDMYLAPLESERDGGEVLRRTLRAYFAADRNVSSAAAALNVKRHTVSRRLRLAEEGIGRPLGKCGTELETALRLEELTGWPISGQRESRSLKTWPLDGPHWSSASY